MLEAQCKAVRPDFLSAKSTEACESNEKRGIQNAQKGCQKMTCSQDVFAENPMWIDPHHFLGLKKTALATLRCGECWIGVLMTLMTSCKRSSFAWCAGDTFVLLKAKALSKRYFKWRSFIYTFHLLGFASVPPEQTFNLVLQLPWHNRRNYQHSAVLSQDLSWLRPGPSVRSWRWKHKTKKCFQISPPFSGGWLNQPIRNIWTSNWNFSPNMGEKKIFETTT